MPPERASWAAAMRIEIELIGRPGAAVWFALGCLWACCDARVRSHTATPLFIQLALGAATSLLTAVALFTVARWIFESAIYSTPLPSLPAIALACAGLAYAFGAICISRWGPAALIRLACGVLAVVGLAYLLTYRVSQDLPGLHLLHALTVEVFGVWSLLVAMSVVAIRSTRSGRSATT